MPGGDPLLVAPATTSGVGHAGMGSRTPRTRAAPRGSSRSPRRSHPARGARAVALAASMVATGAVAAALGYSEGAWSAESASDVNASAGQPVDSNNVDSSAPTDTVTSTTPSTMVTSTTIPMATQPGAVTADSSAYADGIYLGIAEYTEWGDVQVQVTITSGEITDVTAVEYPTGRKSSSINGEAIPMLEAEAVATQSADLDIVSGATYTSLTYADSLQAALDQAAVAATQEAGLS